MDMTLERDADIGGDFFLQLFRLTERLAKRHEIPLDRAADFLLAGSLFTASHILELSVDETIELVQEIGESVQEDGLPPETRH
jgi:hypothetical protein